MSTEALINKIKTQLNNRSLFAIFDRDGTLVPFNPAPEKAIFSPSLKDLLQKLAACKRVSVAILSARDLRQLSRDFDKPNFILAGNYGMEIVFPDKLCFIHTPAAAYRPFLFTAKETLQQKLPAVAKTILEDHGLTLCLHWHRTPADQLENVHTIIEQLKNAIPELVFNKLPTSYEIWPPVTWNKASGLSEMERILRINWQEWLPVYAGDSSSDEAAFQWINARHGITLRIGQSNDSAAQFQLESPAKMEEFLKELVKLMQSMNGSAS